MSKYIKLEDAISLFGRSGEYHADAIVDMLFFLPTTEVSEDAISRATALEIYSDLYWIDERLLNFKDELDKVYEKLRNAPSVIPKAKEGECPYFIDGVWCNLVGKKMKGAE